MASIGQSSRGGDGEVFGPYLVFERIGVGGMATVHRAKERGIEGFERMVALKRLLPHLAEDEKFVRSFVREAKLASLLQHANVVQLYELGRVSHVYFISMELIEGRDVRQILRQARKITGPPPIPVVISILCQLCDALDYAHTRADEHGQPLGLVHRDVSPSNVLIAESGHVKVIDFGIAKATSIHLKTQTGRVKGKMAYMSPEAIKGMHLDARSDMFSTGVLAHELLTARPLFATKNDYQTLMRVQKATVAPPSTYNQDCPAELDAIILKALSRDRENRWQSAAEMRDSLNDLRRAYQLNATHGEISAWMKWAFALEERPTTNAALARARTSTPVNVPITPRPIYGDLAAKSYLHTPATGPLQIPIGGVALPVAEEDDEVIEIAWGGRSSERGVPVLLDEVPDVSEKMIAPAIIARASNTMVNRAPPPPRPTRAPSISWARGTFNSEEDEELDLDRQPVEVPRTASGPVIITPTHITPSRTHPGLPIIADVEDEDDRQASGSMPLVTFRDRRPPARVATEFGAAIVSREQRSYGKAVAIVGLTAALLGVGALVAFRDGGAGATAGAAIPAAQATLKFDVEPVDAEIEIAGHGTHRGSPLELTMESGEYQVAVSREGYNSWVSTIEIAATETQTIRVVLERGGSELAKVAIRSTPPGKTVSVDGVAQPEVTPTVIDLPPGQHMLTIVEDGDELWHHQLEVAANTHYELHPIIDEARQRRHRARALREQSVTIEAPTTGHASGDWEATTPEARLPEITLDMKAPPPAPIRQRGPIVVPPGAVTKISGKVPVIRRRAGDESLDRLSVKLCTDTGGKVTAVTFLTAVPGDLEGKLRDALTGWRYQPYRDGGELVPVCFALSFKPE